GRSPRARAAWAPGAGRRDEKRLPPRVDWTQKARTAAAFPARATPLRLPAGRPRLPENAQRRRLQGSKILAQGTGEAGDPRPRLRRRRRPNGCRDLAPAP